MTNYNDGEWHIWNGGECPVHPETVVQAQLSDETRDDVLREPKSYSAPGKLLDWGYDDGGYDIIAFRVVKEYKEAREFWLFSGVAYKTENDALRMKYYCLHPEKGMPILHVREVLTE